MQNKIVNKNYNLKVKRGKSGLGLFALESVKKGEYILKFTGKKLSTKEADEKGGKYLFEINQKITLDMSGRKNICRYINHSCRPNCETEIINNDVYLQAKKNIKAGEELSFDYGSEYFNYYIKPKGCKCEKCRG